MCYLFSSFNKIYFITSNYVCQFQIRSILITIFINLLSVKNNLLISLVNQIKHLDNSKPLDKSYRCS